MKSRCGNYVAQLAGDLQYKAFIPARMPYSINIEPALQKLLSEADLALGKLDGISELIPDIDFFIYMYISKEATLSSQVEGTQATFSDVLKAKAHIKDSEIHNDVDEIINYIAAMNYGLKRISELPISLRLIKELHGHLLKGVRGKGKTPGEFRKTQNWIGGPTIQTATHIPPPAHEIMPLLDNFEKLIHEHNELPLLIQCGLLHAQFELIHPFLDGNGRIGRLLITFFLCQKGILTKPLLYISEFFKNNQQNYYDKLQRISSHDDIESWLKFFLTAIADTSKKAIKTAQQIQKLKEKDVNKVMSLGKSSKSAIKLLNRLYRSPMVRIKDIENFAGLSNPNAILLTEKMEKVGILKEITGKKRNKVYQYLDYINIFK